MAAITYFARFRGVVWLVGTLVVALALVGLWSGGGADHGAKVEDDGNRYLPIRESLIPMFAYGHIHIGGPFSEKRFPFNRIDPAVQKYIIHYFTERTRGRPSGPAGLWLLGFVGDQDALDFVDRYAKRAIELPDFGTRFSNSRFATDLGSCLGMMARRGIEGADSVLRTYGDLTAWLPGSVEAGSQEMINRRRFHEDFLGLAYYCSKDDDLLPLFRHDYPVHFRPVYDEESIAKFKRTPSRYDKLMRPRLLSEAELQGMFDMFQPKWDKRGQS